MSGLIENVNTGKQGDFTGYIFTLPAKRLKELGKISRLHDGQGGVQRRLDENRAAQIAIAMTDRKIFWLDSFLVHLGPEGSWEFQDGMIVYDDRFFLDVDDGQHRLYAMECLNSADLEALGDMTVIATAGLSFEQRLRLFLQQEKRRHLNANLLLTGKSLTGDWSRESERVAHSIVMALNTDARWPLKGRIDFSEIGRVANNSQQLLAHGLFSTIKVIIGQKSLLYGMPEGKQTDIVVRYLQVAAKKVWPKAWDEPDEYMISSSRGVSTLLRMFVSGKTYRMAIGNSDYSDSSLYNLLRLGSGFNWTISEHRNRQDKDVLDRFDNNMSRAYARRENDRKRRK